MSTNWINNAITRAEIKITGKAHKIRTLNLGENSDNMGRCDMVRQTIELNKLMPNDTLRETLLHEIIHVINENCATEMTENQVATISSNLYGVMKDNEISGE